MNKERETLTAPAAILDNPEQVNDTWLMPAAISVPEEWVESVSELKFPASTDSRLQCLMDRNTEGTLDAEGCLELEALVEMSEELSLVRAKAMQFLNRFPG